MATAAAPPDLPLAFDTSIFSPWRQGRQQTARRVTEYIAIHQAPPVLTSITVFEVLQGFENKAHKNAGLSPTDERDFARTQDLIDFVDTILTFDHIASAIAAYVYPRFGRADRRHWPDLLIAATALANGFGVATANVHDFELIGNLLSADHPILYLAIWKD